MQFENAVSSQLCKNTIFEGLTQQQIKEILPCIAMNIKTYNSDECVVDKGDNISNLGVVLDGELHLCDQAGDGHHKKLANVEKNQIFGESAIFSTTSKLTHRVVAKKQAQVLYLSGDFFFMPCDKSCDLRKAHEIIVRNMMRILSDKAIVLGKKIAYLTATDLKAKIAMYLCELYELNQSFSFNMPLNRDRLAEFFAVARPSLSREFIALKNMGIISLNRSSVEILDLQALYNISRGG